MYKRKILIAIQKATPGCFRSSSNFKYFSFCRFILNNYISCCHNFSISTFDAYITPAIKSDSHLYLTGGNLILTFIKNFAVTFGMVHRILVTAVLLSSLATKIIAVYKFN